MAANGIVTLAVNRRRSGVILGTALVLLTGLSGCSSVPDAVNPAEWYKSTVDAFSSDDKDQQAAKDKDKEKSGLVADRGKPPPGAGRSAPNLSSVPDRPRVSSSEERQQIASGLVSDTQRPRYSSEAVQLQGAPTQVLQRPKAAAAPVLPALPATAPSRPAAGGVPASAPAAPVRRAPVTAAAPGAAFPSVAAAPSPPPPMPRGVQETYRARLAQRLPVQESPREVAQAAPASPAPGRTPVPPPANALPPSVGGTYDTVVISGGGVEIGGSAVPTPAPQAGASPRLAVQPSEISNLTPRLPTGTGESIKVATILFSNGSARLDAQDRKILRQVRQLHRQRGGTMRVVGHASSRTRSMDPIKHKMVNYKMSADRANIVVRELIRLGVNKQDIFVDAVSDSVPVYYEIMPTGEAGNRRAEVYLVF